jgi:fatty acid CoA ligase FadD32
MELSDAMSQFYDDKGSIVIPDQVTLPTMNEMLFAMAQMEGATDAPLLSFHDYSQSREGEVVTWSRAEVNTRIKAVCVRLQQVTTRGDRVAILANNSPEYLFGFLGAMYAGTVPVPLYDPTRSPTTGSTRWSPRCRTRSSPRRTSRTRPPSSSSPPARPVPPPAWC